MNDVEGWGCPEAMGLRREESDRATLARRGGLAALVLGIGIWVLGAMNWPADLAFLKALDSAQGRLGAALCAVSGAVALLLSSVALRNRPR